MDVKKKKRIVIISIVCTVAVLLAGVVGGILCFVLRNEEKNEYAEIETFVLDFMESYKTKQPNTVKYLQYANDDMSFKGFQGFLAEQIEYSIKEIKDENNQIVVTLEITNVDFKEVFNGVVEQLPKDATQEDILNSLKQKMSQSDCKKRTFLCDVILVTDGGYKIVMTESLSNALLGGYNEYLTELTQVQEDSADE